MTVIRAAKYLNGSDIGKTITTPAGDTGTIASVEHSPTHTRVRLDPPASDGTHTLLFRHDVEVAITGKDHRQLPPPIPATQAADTTLGHTTVDAVLGSDCGHNGGQGIGAGHTCACIRTAGHPLDSDRPHACPCGALWADTPDHEHIASRQDPEHCVRCGERLEYDKNGNRK